MVVQLAMKTKNEDVLEINRTVQLDESIYQLLKSVPHPITRGELAKLTEVARSTLYDSLTRLIFKGKVKKYSDLGHTTRGRPKVYFEAI